jgi:hypothetical protein
MTIYAIEEILSSKSHNPHYLNRYIKFIESCKLANKDFQGYTERHHICPKADDMFPKYKSLKKHPWNCVALTTRQHFIAHWMLWKTYPGITSMSYAFWTMRHTKGFQIDSKVFSVIKEDFSEKTSENNRKRIAEGTHNFLGGEIARKRVKDGTHNWLDGKKSSESNRKRVDDNTHNLLGSVSCYDKNGKSVSISKDLYHSQTGPMNEWEYVAVGSNEGKSRSSGIVFDGTNHILYGVTSCYDKQGKSIYIPKEIYHSQTGPKEDWEYVHVNSKEGKRRSGYDDSIKHKFHGVVTCFDLEGNYVCVSKEIYRSQTGSIEKCEYVHVNSKEGKRRKQKRNMT